MGLFGKKDEKKALKSKVDKLMKQLMGLLMQKR